MNEIEHDSDDAVMTELLMVADRREILVPREVLEGTRVRLRERTHKPAAGGNAWGGRRVGYAAAAAAIVVMVVAWFARPTGIAWAQVAQAVRELPCVHIQSHDDAGHAVESWLCFSRNVGAMRSAEQVQFDDFHSGVRYQYDPKGQKLWRLTVNGEWSFAAGEALLEGIFRGGDVSRDDAVGLHIVKQRRREVSEGGRQWIVYELDVLNPAGKGDGEKSTVLIRVNPETNLPTAMTVELGGKSRRMDFDYPAEGPADIYALGVPRNVPVEDRTPALDLARILRTVERNRRNFDDYLAIAGEDRGLELNIVRCKGDKWRIDMGLTDGLHLASSADLKRWRETQHKNIPAEGYALCDGTNVYRREPGGANNSWRPESAHVSRGDGRSGANVVGSGSEYFVELLAYTPMLDSLSSSPRFTTTLDAKGEGGPAGTVGIDVRIASDGNTSDRNTFHREQFWLQPKYGYAVVKSAFSDCPAVDADPARKEKRVVTEYEDYRQTPRGVWYPTVKRVKNDSWIEKKDQPGGGEFRDRVTYFYLDFAAELPDGLFAVTAADGAGGLPAVRP